MAANLSLCILIQCETYESAKLLYSRCESFFSEFDKIKWNASLTEPLSQVITPPSVKKTEP